MQCGNLLARSREVPKLQEPQKGGGGSVKKPRPHLTRCDTDLGTRMLLYVVQCHLTGPKGSPLNRGPHKTSLTPPFASRCSLRSSSVLVKRGDTYCIRRERRTVQPEKPAASASGTDATLHRTRGRAYREERKSRKLEAA